MEPAAEPRARLPWLGAFTASAFALGLALLTRPYIGIAHDAVVYIGHAMAALDPNGVGQDLMFKAEGQSGFTVFTPAATALVAALGPGRAAMAIGLAGLAAWVGAAAFLCRQFAPKVVPAWICLAWLLIGPGGYGGFGTFHFAESFANPRPFAEAAVLAALALFLVNRRVLGAVLLLAAAAIHPLIALAGLGVVWAVFVLSDRRWLWLAPLGALAVVVAAALGLPVASRLLEPVDPQWLSVTQFRNPYLWLGLWRMEDWARIVAQASTVIAALSVVEARIRPYLIGALVTAGAGTVLALSASLWPSLLILQLQAWRAEWLLAALSAAVTPILAVCMWREGSRGKAVLALLALAVTVTSVPVVSLLAAAAGLALIEAARRGWKGEPPQSVVITLWAALALVVAGGVTGTAYGLGRQAWAAQVQHVPFGELARGGLLSAAALALAAGRLVTEMHFRGAGRTIHSVFVAATALLLGIVGWDTRAPFAQVAERGPLMTSADIGAAGSVWWLPDQTFAPLITGRPAWLERAQGAGNVFSRPLAVEWRARVGRAARAGVEVSEYRPDMGLPSGPPSMLLPARVVSVCGVDGPAVIVVDASSLEGPLPAGSRLWRAPAPLWSYSLKGGWRRRDTFVITPCP